MNKSQAVCLEALISPDSAVPGLTDGKRAAIRAACEDREVLLDACKTVRGVLVSEPSLRRSASELISTLDGAIDSATEA